jgi:hypothetical protein
MKWNSGIANEAFRRYCWPMSAVVEELDAKLKTLDAKAAASLEKLVRDALELLEAQNGRERPDRLPPDFFTRIAHEFGSEPFERPPQGKFEKREDW